MGRWKFQSDNNLIHLAVEGSVGGTTLGLHVSADTIEDGGRVLWVGEDMPCLLYTAPSPGDGLLSRMPSSA